MIQIFCDFWKYSDVVLIKFGHFLTIVFELNFRALSLVSIVNSPLPLPIPRIDTSTDTLSMPSELLENFANVSSNRDLLAALSSLLE